MADEHRSEAPETTFDWFLSPAYLVPIIRDLTLDLGTEARVLMLGCGNSALSEAVCLSLPVFHIALLYTPKPVGIRS